MKRRLKESLAAMFVLVLGGLGSLVVAGTAEAQSFQQIGSNCFNNNISGWSVGIVCWAVSKDVGDYSSTQDYFGMRMTESANATDGK